MVSWRSCGKHIICFALILAVVILYLTFLLKTYDTTVGRSTVDTSLDIFERRQKLQQQKHQALMNEFRETLKNIKTVPNGEHPDLAKDGNTKDIANPPPQNIIGGERSEAGYPNKINNQVLGETSAESKLVKNDKSSLQTGDKLQEWHTEDKIHKKVVDEPNNPPEAGMKSVSKWTTTKPHAIDSAVSPGNTSLKYTENVDIGSGSYKAYWVNERGPLLERVTKYNAAIHQLRQQLVKERGDRPWQPLSGIMESLWCNLDDFHKEIEKYPIVKTVSLAWHSKVQEEGRNALWHSSVDRENILLNSYFSWSASENLCRWVHTAGFTRARWDAVYNRTCKTLSELPKSSGKEQLEPVYLHGKPINKNHYWPHYGTSYPKYFYTTPPPQVLYMHILEDAVVTSLGDVISGNLKLVPYSCSQDVEASPPPNYQFSPMYDEVFVMGQYWGASFFHMMIENLPRIAPYLEFLKMNPDILIHAQATDGYTARSLRMLGLNSTRLIKGTIRARRVYLSQATPCGFPHLQSLQILSHYYHNYIHTLPQHPKHNRRSLLLIRRSGSRRFTQHLRIREELETVAMEFDLDFEMFIDNPSPPVETAMVLFHTAALVVGPHGAGLSNLVYCQPGTMVIEGVCNPPHVNMCYQWTAHVLGLRYHGIGSRGGCETWVDVDATQLATAARELLKNYANP